MRIKLSNIVIVILLIILGITNLYSHTGHYKDLIKIEMDIYRNGEVIGYSNYLFKSSGNIFQVINQTEFEVKVLGVKLLSVNSLSKEIYENEQLIEFNSETIQNNKKKFVNLKYDKKNDNFNIIGSSYKGKADKENIVGSWWNHKILTASGQISPLSGSIKKQEVLFISKETLNIDNKSFEVDHFKLKSTDEGLEEDKKLNFDIWLDRKKNIIVKVEYNRLGKWQYILKNVE
tara:strand:+ start:74 stop:769 length:696 start_codon:yes stop_codon:yes gene_type:complete